LACQKPIRSELTGRSSAAARWSSLGERGCRLPDGRIDPPPSKVTPVDTSGAGDAFNAGYLDARLRGEPPHLAARQGHKLAAWTIARRGAIPDVV